MSDNEHIATTDPETVVQEVLTPERKEELAGRIEKLKAALDAVESNMNKSVKIPMDISLVTQQLELIKTIAHEVRQNITLVTSLRHSREVDEISVRSLGSLKKIAEMYDEALEHIV